MKREIKFRAIDKKTKKVVFEGTLSEVRNAAGRFNFTTWEWLEYTGLKDKNKKEIYEGDILRCISKDNFEHKSTISLGWSEDDEYGWCWKSGAIIRNVDLIDERYEVIGNLFENPELLKSH